MASNSDVNEDKAGVSGEVLSILSSETLQRVTNFIEEGGSFENIPAADMKAAARVVAESFRHVVESQGLPDISQPKSAPLSESIVMRALVLLRILWERDNKYSYAVKSARSVDPDFDPGFDRIPKQDELCSKVKKKKGETLPPDAPKYKGLMRDAFEELDLARVGFPPDSSCSGPPHVLISASVLSESGCIVPRGYGTWNAKDENPDHPVRNPYALLPAGKLLSYRMFGDANFVLYNSLRGFSGITPVVQLKSGESYSGWLKYIGLIE